MAFCRTPDITIVNKIADERISVSKKLSPATYIICIKTKEGNYFKKLIIQPY